MTLHEDYLLNFKELAKLRDILNARVFSIARNFAAEHKALGVAAKDDKDFVSKTLRHNILDLQEDIYNLIRFLDYYSLEQEARHKDGERKNTVLRNHYKYWARKCSDLEVRLSLLERARYDDTKIAILTREIANDKNTKREAEILPPTTDGNSHAEQSINARPKTKD